MGVLDVAGTLAGRDRAHAPDLLIPDGGHVGIRVLRAGAPRDRERDRGKPPAHRGQRPRVPGLDAPGGGEGVHQRVDPDRIAHDPERPLFADLRGPGPAVRPPAGHRRGDHLLPIVRPPRRDPARVQERGRPAAGRLPGLPLHRVRAVGRQRRAELPPLARVPAARARVLLQRRRRRGAHLRGGRHLPATCSTGAARACSTSSARSCRGRSRARTTSRAWRTAA